MGVIAKRKGEELQVWIDKSAPCEPLTSLVNIKKNGSAAPDPS